MNFYKFIEDNDIIIKPYVYNYSIPQCDPPLFCLSDIPILKSIKSMQLEEHMNLEKDNNLEFTSTYLSSKNALYTKSVSLFYGLLHTDYDLISIDVDDKSSKMIMNI